jgi:hypothetical protein
MAGDLREYRKNQVRGNDAIVGIGVKDLIVPALLDSTDKRFEDRIGNLGLVENGHQTLIFLRLVIADRSFQIFSKGVAKMLVGQIPIYRGSNELEFALHGDALERLFATSTIRRMPSLLATAVFRRV